MTEKSSLSRLTNPAYLLLASELERHGNQLSGEHRAALYHLCGTLTEFATGEIRGRKVFALSTGLGKTSAIIAWIATLYRIGGEADKVSVAVSASKVEALCSIKRALVGHGVPEAVIGLKHSLGSAASLPSTGDEDRRFMLVTHQRVRGGTNHQLFTRHLGQPRAVMVYDESLFRSDCVAISERDVRSDLAYVRERVSGRKDCLGVLAYLDNCRELIVTSVAAVRTSGQDSALTIALPPLGDVERTGYAELLKGIPLSDTLGDLVSLAGQELRVAVTPQNEGVLWHRVAVPSELDRVLVLDASYPIRQLCKLDPTLEPASRFSDAVVKRFDNVTVHQMFAFGGRNTVEKSFREKREKRAVSREVVEVVKRLPPEESALIFTFKRRTVDIKGILLDDLRASGVDVDAVQPNGKRRISVLTWGDETSLNDYAHCENVILAGVIHRSLLDIASAVVGQLDDRSADLGGQRLLELLESEVAHSIFQALSRGKCREVNCGQAKRMNAWLIYPRLSIRGHLAPAMPGATWAVWTPVGSGIADGVVVRMALALLEYLQRLPAETRKVSARAVKKALGVPQQHEKAFSRAVDRLGDLAAEWTREGRSLVRIDGALYGFTPET